MIVLFIVFTYVPTKLYYFQFIPITNQINFSEVPIKKSHNLLRCIVYYLTLKSVFLRKFLLDHSLSTNFNYRFIIPYTSYICVDIFKMWFIWIFNYLDGAYFSIHPNIYILKHVGIISENSSICFLNEWVLFKLGYQNI